MTPRRRTWELAALLAGAALLFGLALGARDLWNPNEPTYGRAVAEMVAAEAWLVPTVNGLQFGEKPILYFWLARLSALGLSGVNEWSLRLPSSLSGLAMVLLVWVLVGRYASARRATAAAALAATTYVIFWSSRQIQMDLLVAVTTLGAVVAVCGVVDHGRRSVTGWLLAGACVGAGLLAKGPVGLLYPALVLLPYLLLERRIGVLRPGALGLAALGALAVGGPWYLALVLRGETAVLRELLLRQNVERLVAPWDHQAPWWYYGMHFWLDMAPWAWFLPLSIGLVPEDDRERRLHRLAWIWILVTVAFFSLATSKRSPYILPVAPAVAILVSGVWWRWGAGRLSRLRATAALLVTILFAVLLIACSVWLGVAGLERFADDSGLSRAALITVPGLLLAGSVIVVAACFRRRQRSAAGAAMLASVVAIYLLAAVAVLPALDTRKSHRGFCAELNARVARDAPLYGYRLWRWRASYSYYSDRSILSLETPDELVRYWSRDEPVYLIVERGMLDEVRELLGPLEPLVGREIGSNAVFLFGTGSP